MTDREVFVAGVGLYLGDGAKGDRAVDFSNSDPEIINFMMDWFRKFCRVKEDRFRGAVWIHSNQDVELAENFWVDLTGIPKSQFHKTYVARLKKGSNKVRKNRHKHGIFKIKICDVDLQRKIRGWMAGILQAKIVK